MKQISKEVLEILPQAQLWRRDLHAHPEIGFEEHRTAALVADVLRELRIDVCAGVGTTGVVGSLSCGNSGRCLALRADMDALPLTEQGTAAWRSVTPHAFHGCGHDGHTAVLLAAATALRRRARFNGTVHFIFQPAEEGLGGGEAMLRDGLFDRFACEAVYGMHNWPGAPLGTIGTRAGALMAGLTQIDIEVTGTGGHAGLPQRCTDPIHSATLLVQALQGLVSRNADPVTPTVLSVTQFHSGSAYNVIPSVARLAGGLRYLDAAESRRIESRLEEIADGVARATGAAIAVHLKRLFPVLENDAECARRALDVGATFLGEAQTWRDYGPFMGADDFAWMMQRKPGCYLLLGSGDAAHTEMPHHPCYDFNDELLPIAAEYWVRLVETLLQ